MNQADPMKKMRILVENRHGALLKIVGVFTTRAYNINTLERHAGSGRRVEPDDRDAALQQSIGSNNCANS